MIGRTLGRSTLALGVAAVLVGACSEATPDAATGDRSVTTTRAGLDCPAEASIVDCVPAESMLAPLVPDTATRATGTPILIGMINQDTGATGAFPELTSAAKVAVDFVNEEMNGVDGRPIELVTCNTEFSVDLSQACAQQMVDRGVPAVVGGIDIWGTGIATLENNGVPFVGSIPVSFAAVRSPVSFQFSGGTWGAVLGMGQYAIEELDAKRIAVIAAEFAPITDSAELGKAAMERHDATVTIVPVPALNADMVQALNTAAATDPDAIIALTADSGCRPTMLTVKQLRLEVPVMYTGACATPAVIDSVEGAAEGALFNLEAELDPDSGDNALYRTIVDRYGERYDYEWQSAGTASFRSVMNLYAVLRELGAEGISRDAVLEAFRDSVDAPSFFGHPYTCDGEQLDGYPAICAPQQNLGQLQDGRLVAVTDWLDVNAFAAARDAEGSPSPSTSSSR